MIAAGGKRPRLTGIGRCELDSHADTGCAGPDCHVEYTTDQVVNVHPFSTESNAVTNVPIGTVIYAVNDPESGDTKLLVLHEQLLFGDRMQMSLLPPNQLRSFGLTVSDCPKQFDPASLHSISIPRDSSKPLQLPLQLEGTTSYFDIRKPTSEELKYCERLQCTSSNPWDPGSPDWRQKESDALRVYAASKQIREKGEEGRLPASPATFLAELQMEREEQARRLCYLQSALPHEDVLPLALSPGNGHADCFAMSSHPGGHKDKMIHRLVASVQISSSQRMSDDIDSPLDERAANEYKLRISATRTAGRNSVLTKEVLARRWGTSLETADRTLKATTQEGIRIAPRNVERRFKSFSKHLNYPTLMGRWYSDTLFAKCRSIRNYTCGQLFTNGLGDTFIYPLRKKREAGHALKSFILENGSVETLITDNAKEEGKQGAYDTLWNKLVDDYMIRHLTTAPYSQFQNRAEAEIRELKRGTWKFLRLKRAPKRLWCFCAGWYAGVRRLTALDIYRLQGRTPAESRLGSTPDISEYAQFDWYDFVKYNDVAADDNQKVRYGRLVGPCESSGTNMCFYILTEKCTVLVRDTVSSLSDEESKSDETKKRIIDFDKLVNAKIGDRPTKRGEIELDAEMLDQGGTQPEIPAELFNTDADNFDWDLEEPEAAMLEVDDYDADTTDTYLNADVVMPRGGDFERGKVIRRSKGPDMNPIGKANRNPILDTRSYEIQFEDGEVSTYQANMIAEHMSSRCDDEGHELMLMHEIIDHRKNGDAIASDDGFVRSKNGNMIPKKTTKGWSLLVNWKDKSSSWVPLKDLKESHAVQVAEYAVGNKIAEEPAFKWWVSPVLRKRDRIIMKIKTAYKRKMHKYGIRIPRNVKEAYEIDMENGDTHWSDAINKEMKNVRVAFEFNDGDITPIGHKPLEVHMIFDVKMMTLQRKARLVAGGHKTEVPKDSVYSSVVSRESVRLAFLAAALNDVDILAADIQNAYLSASTKEKLYCIVGAEFGSDAGRPAKIVRALYGLRSSGKMFREHLARTLREDLKFFPCKADPDVWMRKATKPDGFEYWEYILCYVDDVLAISHKPQELLDAVSENFTLKAGSVKEPDLYLGADISKYYIEESDQPTKCRWAMSSDSYVKNAVQTVEKTIKEVGMEFLPKKKIETPITSGYKPESDSSAELDPERLNYFQGLIGVLRWICELGRLDIVLPVALLSRYLASPRWGHLEQALHIFAYLKKYNRSKMVFDESMPDFEDTSEFANADWLEMYPDAKEVIPLDMPQARGKPVVMSCFEDADHAGDLVTRRSHTGLIVFVNRAPIYWYSKKQNTVESSTFGSEFVAMRQAVEIIEGLRYKVRMMGFPLEGPCNVFCDNNAVVQNTSRPESTLKKKHLSVSYHRCREAQAAGTVKIAKEGTNTNIADMFTKLLAGTKLRELCSFCLW